MPELPDITIYLESLDRLVVGHRLTKFELLSPFVLRSVHPKPADFIGKKIVGTRRLGKRIVLEFESQHFMVIHLMIAGRLHWLRADQKLPRSCTLLGLHIGEHHGILQFTEAGKKKRASIHLLSGEEELANHDPGGLELDSASFDEFAQAITNRNHTLKRVLTDPHILSGIGNAYSDEILHAAKLSPIAHSQKLSKVELERLFAACKATLQEWTERLREQVGSGFPRKVTAFHPEMAVHGRFGQACPRCKAPVQRIVYGDRETNYCAPCQTEGRLLADRALSRLLKKDWPKTMEEFEARIDKNRNSAPG